MRLAACLSALLVLVPAVASAQPSERGYLQAIGGLSTTSVTDALVGGGIAVQAFDCVDVFGEIGRLRNGIWSSLESELRTAGDAISSDIAARFGPGAAASFDARVPVWYGLGGARLRGPTLGRFMPYIEGGIGFARLRPEVRLEIGGERLDSEAARLLTLEDERSELMSAAGAGVSFHLWGPLRAEAGYRYSRIHGEVPVNVNRVHAGLGYGF